nr:trypsin-like protease [Hymenolepis microstoma]
MRITIALRQFTDFVDATDTAVDVTTSIEVRTSNASCSKYFDKYCEVKDIENPYCVYQKYKTDTEYEILNLSPKVHKLCRTCGLQQLHKYDRVINKIYGGREAVPHSWPWMAGLFVWNNNNNNINTLFQRQIHPQMICASTLISEKHAITAAHCLKNSLKCMQIVEKQWYPTQKTRNIRFFLRFGDHLRNDQYFEPQIDIHVLRFMIYKSGVDSFDGDVAILELERPVEFTPEIHPLCLPPPNLNLEEETGCIAVGWGLLDKNPPIFAQTLQEVEIEIASPAKCLSESQSFRLDMQVCALHSKTGVLNGDSGGGLYCKIHPDDQQWYLYGIISYTQWPAGFSGFSRVPYYVEWIHENAK